MQIHIKFVDLDSSAALLEHANKKFGRIDKLMKHIDPEGHGFVYLEISRITRHHQKGLVFAADANLHSPLKMFRARAQAMDARTAVNELADTLLMEVERYKESLESRRRASRG